MKELIKQLLKRIGKDALLAILQFIIELLREKHGINKTLIN